MQNQFQIGDSVQIRPDLKYGNKYKTTINRDMSDNKGKLTTISGIRRKNIYELDIDDGRWAWSADTLISSHQQQTTNRG